MAEAARRQAGQTHPAAIRRPPRRGSEAKVKFHRDAYSTVIAMLVLAGLIAILLALVNPVR